MTSVLPSPVLMELSVLTIQDIMNVFVLKAGKVLIVAQVIIK
jgi:hypothetical protein